MKAAIMLVALLGLVLISDAAVAANQAGKVVFTAGQVTVERPQAIGLGKDDLVFENDIIVTAPRSRAQLYMIDGAKLALRPDTRLEIAEYFKAGDRVEQPDGSIVVAAKNSAVTGLIKGGFRTITGAIGKEDPTAYEVRTPAATMGIRGTHYSVVYCAGDCKLPTAKSTSQPIVDGLYIGVSDGVVSVSNNTGSYLMNAGEFVYVKDPETAPINLPEIPSALVDTDPTVAANEERAATEVSSTIAAIAASGSNSDNIGLAPPGSAPLSSSRSAKGTPAPAVPPPAEAQTRAGDTYDISTAGFDGEPDVPLTTDTGVPVTDGTIPNTRALSYAVGPNTGLNTAGISISSLRGNRTLSGNDLIGFEAPAPGVTGDLGFAIGTAAIRDDGFDPATGMGWARWSGGAATATRSTGAATNLNLSAQSLHYVYGPLINSAASLPLTGSANFSLIAGNTDPTDTLGQTGVLGNATLFANFTTATVQSELALNIGGNIWQANGNGSIAGQLFNGLYNNISVGGQAGGNGNFSGFFGAAGTNGLPNGAGLTYGLSDSQGVTVSGAVVFGQPSP